MTYIDLNSTLGVDELLVQQRSPYVLLLLSLVVTVSAIYFKLYANTSSLPTIPGHWFYKHQQLIAAPWRAILLAEKYKPVYGDIIHLLEPLKTRVVLNSADLISEVLDKQSATTSDRPRNVMLFEMTGISDTIAFRSHDEQHKKLRRVIASGLHPAAARSYTELHSSTSAYFLRDVLFRIGGDTVIIPDANEEQINLKLSDVADHSKALAASIQDSIGRFILRMTYGYVATEDDPLLKRNNQVVLFTASNFAKHFWVNDFPILRYIPSWLPGAGFKRLARRIREMRMRNLAETFEPVLNNSHQGTVQLPSYTSNLIELKGGKNINEEDMELVKWTSASMFAAGSTTTTALVHSFIFAMCIHPEIAIKVQAEIDAHVGRDRIPTLLDRDVLPYTEAVLQEVIRFYPVFPLGLEHCASEDIEVRGCKIKKGTIIEANIWACMREPTTYPDPHTFNPERFLKPTPDPDPRRFLFGFGRRVCPGQHVANNGAFTMCAAFMSVFDIVASEETMKRVEGCKKEPWKMLTPYGPLEPKPFGCTIRPRDAAASEVLETCKVSAIIA